MATLLTKEWQTISTYTWFAGGSNPQNTVTFYMDAKVSDYNIETNKTPIYTRLRSTTVYTGNGGSNYKYTLSYAPTISGSDTWWFDNETIIETDNTIDNLVPHENDGTKTLTLSALVYNGYKGLNYTLTADVKLPTIPRKTTIKATSTEIGSISTLYLTINSTSFNHQLLWRYPNEDAWSVIDSNLIFSNTKVNYPWEVPDEIYEAIPNDKEIELIILCDTYNTDGSLVGSDETTMWARVNEGVARPTFSATIKNDGTSGTTYTLTGSETAFIKDYTNAIIDANAVARKSATLQEYRVVNGNKSSTAQDTTINAISTDKFSFFVKDSRQLSPSTGYQTDKYVDTFIEYFAPKVLTSTIERTEQTSTEIIATLSGTYWNGNFGVITNVGTLQYSWRSKLAGSNEWGAWSSWATPTISGSNFYINNLSLGDIYATNSSYDFQFRFIDALSNLDPTKIVTTATQNVTVSTPIVEVGEDAVNVNGEVYRNNTKLPYAVNDYREVQDDTYSCNYANSHFRVYTLWSGDIVPTAYNQGFGAEFPGDNRPYNFHFCLARFRIYGFEWWFPFKAGVYAESRNHSGYWGISNTHNAYLTFYFGGYGGFSFQVKETNGIALSDIHLLEIIGIGRI